jgi:hypothetical protein
MCIETFSLVSCGSLLHFLLSDKVGPQYHHVPFQVIRKDYALVHFPRESQTITLQVPRKSKDWQCNLRVKPDGQSNLRLGKFVRDNSVREGDVCIFQPMTKVKASIFTIMVHLLHRESIGHSPRGRAGNHGRTQANDLTARVKEEAASDGMTHTAQKILSRKLKFMCHISMRILCV